jgi:signal transduction histidine kinase
MSVGETEAPSQPAQNHAPAPTAPPSDEQLPRVLIVDDELPNVRILELLLQKAGGFALRSSTDSREAAPLFREFAPDIVLLDLRMPHLDGFAVLKQIRAYTPPGEILPVLILTADATSATKLRALEAGASDFLSKPLDHAEVLLRIRNHLHTRQLQSQLARHAEELEEIVRARTKDLEQALAEVQQMQGQMIQQERLSAFGTMAGGVAHDFNNALSIILGYSEILLAGNARMAVSERAHAIRTIITAAKDSTRMVSRLREFYRPSDERDSRELVDFVQLAGEAVSLTQPKWRAAGEGRPWPIFVKVDAVPVPPVNGNAAELRELLTNLIFNAVDAMPEGGKITLSVRPEGEHVQVQVSDEGTGMTDEVRTRCLEPFFTTKGEQGTGLGLAMVYGIAQRHQATLSLESELGSGTTFSFLFPAQAAAAAGAAAGTVRLAHPLHILVVDDQPFICEIMAQYFAEDCHTTVTAGNGEEALARLREQRFDLLMTDQAMPDLAGDQLAAAAKQIDPNIRVIVLTGYGKEAAMSAGEEAIDQILAKPVSLETLRQALAEVFAPAPGDRPPGNA